jgi:hypothetical protein
MDSKIFSKLAAGALGLLSVATLITACAPSSTSFGTISYNSAPGNYLPANGISASAQSMFGTYTSYLTAESPVDSGDQGNSQPATITLQPATVQGSQGTYVNLTLVSSGSAFGSIQFTSLMNIYSNNMGNGNSSEVVYGLVSRPSVIQNLSTPPVCPYNDPVSIQVTIALINGTQFDPSSSSIAIMDDGLSQSTEGSTPYGYAAFNGLVQQSP